MFEQVLFGFSILYLVKCGFQSPPPVPPDEPKKVEGGEPAADDKEDGEGGAIDLEGENNNQSEAIAGQNAAEGEKSAVNGAGGKQTGEKKPAANAIPPLIDTDKLTEDMAALKPTIFLALPTTYAVLYQKI